MEAIPDNTHPAGKVWQAGRRPWCGPRGRSAAPRSPGWLRASSLTPWALRFLSGSESGTDSGGKAEVSAEQRQRFTRRASVQVARASRGASEPGPSARVPSRWGTASGRPRHDPSVRCPPARSWAGFPSLPDRVLVVTVQQLLLDPSTVEELWACGQVVRGLPAHIRSRTRPRPRPRLGRRLRVGAPCKRPIEVAPPRPHLSAASALSRGLVPPHHSHGILGAVVTRRRTVPRRPRAASLRVSVVRVASKSSSYRAVTEATTCSTRKSELSEAAGSGPGARGL